MSTNNLGDVRQLGYVVEDLSTAMQAWQDKLAVGPWTVMRNIELDCEFLGQPSRPVIDIALSYRGEQQIELIQQHNDAPSPYLSCLQEGRFGLHHIAFLSADIEADVQRLQGQGMKLLCDIRMPGPGGGRYVYFESPVPGEATYIELLEATPVMRGLFAEGTAAARQWQGEARNLSMNLGPMLGLMRAVRRVLGR